MLKFLLKTLIATFFVLQTACGSLTIRPASFPHLDNVVLNQLVSKKIKLQSSHEQPLSLGHQFGFVILPLVTVYTSSLSTDLKNAFEESLLLHRSLGSYRSKTTVELSKISLNVFDYIFYRKTVCELEGQLTLLQDAASYSISADSHWWSAFGFRKELEHTYISCLRKFAQQVLLSLDNINLGVLLK